MSTPPVIDNQNPVMGFEGKIYVGPRGTTSLTNMILLEDVKDPTYTYKFDEVEVNTRRHGGNKVYAKGLKDVGISFTLPNIKPAGPAVALVLQALHNRRMPIAIAMLDEEGGEGPFGDFEILGGDKAEETERSRNRSRSQAVRRRSQSRMVQGTHQLVASGE